MTNSQYNQYNGRRYIRKKQWYRFILGLKHLFYNPLVNLIWIIYIVGVVFLQFVVEKLMSRLVEYPLTEYIFVIFRGLCLIVIPVLCAIGIVQLIGYFFAVKDEAIVSSVFENGIDIRRYPPILIHKRTSKKTGVTVREFYTTIPMQRWIVCTEALCDALNIHLVGDRITYGGKNRDVGCRIIIQSAKGRLVKNRGVLYDETL